MKKCLNCNIKYDDDWYSCPKCGAVLKNDNPRTTPEDALRIKDERAIEKDLNANLIGVISMCLFFIFLILGLYFDSIFFVLALIALVVKLICAAVRKSLSEQVTAAMNRNRKKMEEGRKEKQKEQQRIVENDKMIAFYDKCVENGIHNLDTNDALQKASLIAQTFNLHVACTECYNRGKALKMEKQMNKMLSEEKIKYNMLTKYSEFVGIDKSIKMIKDLIIQDKNQLEELEKTSRLMLAAGVSFQEKEHDWAIAGGIANGLAGGAAAISTVMEIQQKNAEIRARNEANQKAYINSIMPAHMRLTGKQVDIEKDLKELENKLEKIKIKLVENSNEQELLNMITFKNINVNFSDTGAFTVNASSTVRKPITMYENTNATIDGTVQVDLFQDGQSVGKAVLVAPINGFNNASLQGICLANNNTAQKDKPYKIKIKPYHLWKVEA